MCVTKVCCCGCTLRHGAITAAVFKAIEAFILIAGGILYIVLDYNMTTNTSVPIYGVVALSQGLISLVIFICLVIGITKNKAGFVIPWLIGCMFEIVISCILLILVLVSLGFFVFLFGAIVCLPGVAFGIYLWIVVLNYYRELRDSPPPYNPEIKA